MERGGGEKVDATDIREAAGNGLRCHGGLKFRGNFDTFLVGWTYSLGKGY